jgi:hypothetical protein
MQANRSLMTDPLRVLLLQLDGKLPNVALMRIAAHHRALGDEVELRRAGNLRSLEPRLWDKHDTVYGSLIFEQSRPLALRLLKAHPGAVVGGTGWKVSSNLEEHGITTTEQDYSIYPAFQSSIGFLQRGCRLRCPFCVVPVKEGKVRHEQTVDELWRGDPWPRELLLLDNDFFGNPQWRERISEIRDGDFKVSFSQGINCRAIGPEEAEALASVNYRDDGMKVKRIYTAWDNKKDEKRLFRGLQLLVDAGVKPDNIMVYILIGYWPGETTEDREYRRAQLREFGARPYPMPFVRTPELVGFQRWIIGAYDKTVPWSEWVSARYRPERLDLKSAQPSLWGATT